MADDKKRLMFVLPFMIFVGAVIVFLIMRNNNLFDQIIADDSTMSGVSFYKDFIRDSEGLDIPLTDPGDVAHFYDQVRGMEKTSRAAKSLTFEEITKVRFTIQSGEGKTNNFELHIIRSEELGDRAFLTLSLLVPGGTSSAGNFESDTFLDWVYWMAERDELGRIIEYR